MWGTNQFVLLQVESLQFTAAFGQRHHAFVCDTVALTQVDVLQLTTVLPELKCKKKKQEYLIETINENMPSELMNILILRVWISSLVPFLEPRRSVCPGCPHALWPAGGSACPRPTGTRRRAACSGMLCTSAGWGSGRPERTPHGREPLCSPRC